MRVTWTALASAIVLLSASARATNCVPGAQTQCACPGGGSGIQICSDDGSRLGACSNCTMPAPQMMQPMQPMYAPQRPETRRNAPGLWAGGLITMVVSVVFLPVGAGMIVGGAVDDGCDKHDTGICIGGGVLAGLGLLGLAGGIVMMVIGGQRVPANGPQQAWWVPTPQISSRGGALSWTF